MTSPIPVIRIGPVLIVSIQVELNDSVACALQELVLKTVEESGATALLIDVSAVDIVDSFISRVLSDTARTARIMNAEVVVVGIQPTVAITLMEMGLVLPDIRTAISVELGLEALGYRLERIETANAGPVETNPEPAGSHGAGANV